MSKRFHSPDSREPSVTKGLVIFQLVKEVFLDMRFGGLHQLLVRRALGGITCSVFPKNDRFVVHDCFILYRKLLDPFGWFLHYSYVLFPSLLPHLLNTLFPLPCHWVDRDNSLLPSPENLQRTTRCLLTHIAFFWFYLL
jgi:hypothetical protein